MNQLLRLKRENTEETARFLDRDYFLSNTTGVSNVCVCIQCLRHEELWGTKSSKITVTVKFN